MLKWMIGAMMLATPVVAENRVRSFDNLISSVVGQEVQAKGALVRLAGDVVGFRPDSGNAHGMTVGFAMNRSDLNAINTCMNANADAGCLVVFNAEIVQTEYGLELLIYEIVRGYQP